MDIKITKKHIAKGIQGDETKCAIALAIMDKFGKDAKVAVSEEEISIVKDTGTTGLSFYWRGLPKNVRQFIEDFDYTRDVKPFNLKLPIS